MSGLMEELLAAWEENRPSAEEIEAQLQAEEREINSLVTLHNELQFFKNMSPYQTHYFVEVDPLLARVIDRLGELCVSEKDLWDIHVYSDWFKDVTGRRPERDFSPYEKLQSMRDYYYAEG